MTSKSRVCLPAALVVAFGAGAQTTTNHLFLDDFHRTSGLGSNWAVAYGSFTTDGTYAVSGSPPINGDWASVLSQLSTADYSVSATIVVPPVSIDCGLAARSADSAYFDRNVYAVKIGSEDGALNLYRRNDWNWTLLASVQAGVVANTAYALQLIVSGSSPVHLEVWLNGTRQIKFDDNSAQALTTGIPGLVTYAAGVKYTNFAVDHAPIEVFEDTFNRLTGLGANWQVWYGSFTTDGATAISGTPPLSGNWASVVPGLATNDYQVSANVVIPSASLDSGLVARGSDSSYFDDNLYAAQIATDGNVNLYRRNNWNWTLLQSVSAGIVAGTNYALRLIATGSTPVHVEVWLNGVPKIAIDDSSTQRVMTGRVGVENYDASVRYANFIVQSLTPPQPVVSVSVSGSGRVTSSPAGIDCPSTSCSVSVASGSTVTLTATPAANYVFSAWSGACTGTGTCSLTMTGDQSVSAAFNPVSQPTISVTVSGNGSVTSDPAGIDCPSTQCSLSVASGTNVTLTAHPGSGSTLSAWGGACSGSGGCSVFVNSNMSVSAIFGTNNPYPCLGHKCAHGEFPPGPWHPYADSSPFNTVVPANAATISDSYCTSHGYAIPAGSTCSDEIRKAILVGLPANRQPSNWITPLDGHFGWPTYYGLLGDPSFNFTCTDFPPSPPPPDGNTCPNFPLNSIGPGGAIVQGNGNPLGGPDHHLTFIDQESLREIDLYDYPAHALPSTSGTVTTGFAGWTRAMTGNGVSQYLGGNAAHFGNLAGRIRIEEMNYALAQQNEDSKYIHHALTITVDCISGHVYPADGNDGAACPSGRPSSGNGFAPPMGAHLRLNMNLSDLNGSAFSAVPEWKKVLLRTLILYGAFINDTGSAFYFDWQLEGGVQYLTWNETDLWRSFGSARATESGSDWYHCRDSDGTSGTDCPQTNPDSYKGLWQTNSDSIDWNARVWNYLEVLAPPAQ